jgi:hypothetical protein
MDIAEIESKYAPLAIITLQLESKELKAGFRETMKAAYQDFGDCIFTRPFNNLSMLRQHLQNPKHPSDVVAS